MGTLAFHVLAWLRAPAPHGPQCHAVTLGSRVTAGGDKQTRKHGREGATARAARTVVSGLQLPTGVETAPERACPWHASRQPHSLSAPGRRHRGTVRANRECEAEGQTAGPRRGTDHQLPGEGRGQQGLSKERGRGRHVMSGLASSGTFACCTELPAGPSCSQMR